MHRKYHLRYQGHFTRLASLARFLTAAAATRLLLALTAPLLIMPASAQAQGNDPGAPCPGGGYNPTPTVVEVAAVPIVVESTTTDYFVLYVSHEVDADTTVDIPVLVKRGEAGTTTLAENVEALPAARYRVEQYLVSDPADVDGDCVDDITELGDPVSMNPVNPAAAIALSVGTVAIPDRDTFDKLSYSDKYIKFVMFGMDTADRPGVYFMNTENYPDHRQFMEVIGLDWEQDVLLNGELTFHPELMSPSGNSGVYYYEFQREPIFSLMGHSHTLLAASIPLLDDNLALYISNGYLQYSQAELPLFRESRIPLLFDEDIHADTSFLSLNPGEGYGLLRVMDPDERPHPRDIVIYEALPNELPRVAGIVSTVPQTPLSHVNLRAVQDGVPNAFIRGALDEDEIDDLIGGYVRYTVTETGWDIRAATRAQVDAHYTSSRPTGEQTPQRDLSVTSITPLGEIGFEDWTAFGVKAANVAVLGTLGFPVGTVPDGFAIPFYFYDDFMKANGFHDRIEQMLADPAFQTDFDVQDDMLDDLRDDIEDADSPQWIIDALTAMHATFPEGQSLRYRSSTNNEDLPGFNGAGLYDSKTQDPEETEEDGIDKSLKGVFASLWNFRAFTERDFNRIDHLAAKMGVLVHPNYSDELANGVAVSFDPIRGLDGYYYVNTQVGEDLVTNPEAHSIPEELLLRQDQGTYAVLSTSNLVESGELLMSDAQLIQLRDHLTVIHERFAVLYNPAPDEPFAMEIEFKITSDNVLAIKQARPWVFSGGGGTGGGGGGGSGGVRQTVPDAPRNLLADGGDEQVTLSWEAPDDGGFAITDYEVRINGRGSWIFIGSTHTTHTVTGLTNGTVYVFQVRAVNAAGSSPYSNRAEATPGVGALDFAHFANGAGIISDLVFVNVAPHPIRPALYFYDQEGHPIDPESVVDLMGDLEVTEDGALTVQTEMEPLGELPISTHGRGELVSGSVTVAANGPIGGVLRFDLPGIGVAGVGAGQPVRDAIFPARRQAGGIRTAAALHNLGEEAITVSCRLMSGGIVLEAVEIDLEANGQEARYIEEVFTATDTSDFVGSVRCTAPDLFTGIAVELDAGNRIFTTLPVVPVARAGGGGQEAVLYFAHFANGSGTTSDLVFVNVSPRPSGPGPTPFHAAVSPSRPALYFYDQEGNLMDPASVVDLTGDLEVTGDGALSIQTEMEPLGELTISTHGRGELMSGSVKVVSEGPIGGVLRYALPGIGVTGVGASQPVRDALFPVRQEGGLDTAAAIRNLTESDLVVTCRLMKDGAVLEETQIPLAANGQEARYIEELFPRTDTSDFVGSVRCTAPGEGTFTGVAVELDASNQIFTTLPVVPVSERMFQE